MHTLYWMLTACTLLLLTSCSHSASSSDGGQDGGGGIVKSSSAEEVRSAINDVLFLAQDPSQSTNPFFEFLMASVGNFFESNGVFLDNDLYDRVSDAISGKAICQTLPGPDQTRVCSPENENGYFYKLFIVSKIEIKAKGDCGWSDGDHADASVSSMSPGATVCFSVERLQRIPRPDLLKEILALTFHEVLHLGGIQEADARKVQELFRSYYDLRFQDLSKDRTVLVTNQTLEQVQNELSEIREAGEADRLAYMLDINDQLLQMPYWSDVAALQLIFRRHEYTGPVAYSYAVAEVLRSVQKYVPCRAGECNSKEIVGRRPAEILEALKSADFIESINQIEKALDVVKNYWQTLSNTSDKIAIDCATVRHLEEFEMLNTGSPIVSSHKITLYPIDQLFWGCE